jgi:hypothetical protein
MLITVNNLLILVDSLTPTIIRAFNLNANVNEVSFTIKESRNLRLTSHYDH